MEPWEISPLWQVDESGEQELEPEEPVLSLASPNEALEECRWSAAVALDPRHRPQTRTRPSGTVRREWRRYPQEAHLLDAANSRYRKLTRAEIAIIQGFEPSWFEVPEVSNRAIIGTIGDAVPPALAKAVVEGVSQVHSWGLKTSLEVCAGAGGLASAALAVQGMRHLGSIDFSPAAVAVLRHEKPWDKGLVTQADLTQVDLIPFRRKVGLLSGGPPCQPWSGGGRRLGFGDDRDLLRPDRHAVAGVEPEAFIFENVPGLISEAELALPR